MHIPKQLKVLGRALGRSLGPLAAEALQQPQVAAHVADLIFGPPKPTPQPFTPKVIIVIAERDAPASASLPNIEGLFDGPQNGNPRVVSSGTINGRSYPIEITTVKQ
jgi:hypothetical protein